MYSILDVAAVGLVEKVWRNSPSRTCTREMGYGHLTAFEKYVKTQTNILMTINDDDGRDVLLKYLIAFMALYGNQHYGMPRWTAIVSGVRDVLQNRAHPACYGRGNEVITAALSQTPTIDGYARP